MLNYEDGAPTIKFAITRRIEKERGVELLEVKVQNHPDADPPFIAVGVLALVDDELVASSLFHLPEEFEHAHLLNEIDEVAEGFKGARINVAMEGKPEPDVRRRMIGTGLRGRWAAHGD